MASWDYWRIMKYDTWNGHIHIKVDAYWCLYIAQQKCSVQKMRRKFLMCLARKQQMDVSGMKSALFLGFHSRFRGIHQWTWLSTSTTRASICRYTKPSWRAQHMSVWPSRRQMQRSKPCEEAGPGRSRCSGFFRASLRCFMWETWCHKVTDLATWGWCTEAIPEWWLGDGLWTSGFKWLNHLNISEPYIPIEKELCLKSPVSPVTPYGFKSVGMAETASRFDAETARPIKTPPARHRNRSTLHPQSPRLRKRRTCVPRLAATWLVLKPPLWKIWKSVGMIRNPIFWGKKMATKPPTSHSRLHSMMLSTSQLRGKPETKKIPWWKANATHYALSG